MKTKMMVIMATFCVLIIFHKNMIVEAGLTKVIKTFKEEYRFWKVIKQYKKEYRKCCKSIKCLPPKICDVKSVSPFICTCKENVKTDQ